MAINSQAIARHEHEELEDKQAGFWLYLMSDAVIFSLLFVTYVTLSWGFAGGPTGAQLFDLKRVAIETALLLVSSLTFGLSAIAAMLKNISHVTLWLIITLILGVAFIYFEVTEFQEMIAKGAGPDRSAFLSAFFVLLGTHGLHVTVGCLWLIIVLIQLRSQGFTSPVYSRFQRLGMFWHFLDLIWIGIFSVVYLPGVLL